MLAIRPNYGLMFGELFEIFILNSNVSVSRPFFSRVCGDFFLINLKKEVATFIRI